MQVPFDFNSASIAGIYYRVDLESIGCIGTLDHWAVAH